MSDSEVPVIKKMKKQRAVRRRQDSDELSSSEEEADAPAKYVSCMNTEAIALSFIVLSTVMAVTVTCL